MKNWLRTKWTQLTSWVKHTWIQIKNWFYGILVALGIIVAGVAAADDVSLTWTNADQWDDDTPLLVEDIEWTVLDHVMFSLDEDIFNLPDRVYVELVRVPATVLSYVDANKANGIHCYVAYHITTNGERSVNSNETCKIIDVRIPGMPTDLSSN